jgi:hypothetical protein
LPWTEKAAKRRRRSTEKRHGQHGNEDGTRTQGNGTGKGVVRFLSFACAHYEEAPPTVEQVFSSFLSGFVRWFVIAGVIAIPLMVIKWIGKKRETKAMRCRRCDYLGAAGHVFHFGVSKRSARSATVTIGS